MNEYAELVDRLREIAIVCRTRNETADAMLRAREGK